MAAGPGPALAALDLLVRRGARKGGFELRVEALDLLAGGVLAVLGPNGAGKSTLLRTLAGLEVPLRGRIERRVAGPVTMVFQRPIAFSGSVEHNVATALSGLRLARAQRRQRAAEALEHFDIARLASRRAATLSGGELRRLALARAFALRPAVLLLDEPFDDLDPAGQEALSLDLRRAIADTNAAVAVVTHDLRRALLLSDRIAVLLEGRVAQQGERDDVLAHPAGLAVARLVGMSNLIEGEVIGAEGSEGEAIQGTLGAGERAERLPSGSRGARRAAPAQVAVDPQHRIPVETRFASGTPVWAGIRPELLKVDVGRGEGLPIGKGRVCTVVSDGVAATVTLEWAGRELCTRLLAGRGLARSIAPGDSVTRSVRPEDIHLIPRGQGGATGG
jgi:ABC-type sulfate/molybdate transport systems ATPase subunit